MPASLQKYLAYLSVTLAFCAPALPVSGLELEDLGDYAFVASRNTSEIAVISTSDDKLVGTLKMQTIPDRIVISDNWRKLVATQASAKQLAIFDLDRSAVTTTIDLGFRPGAIQIDDETGKIAVADIIDGKLAMVSLGTEELLFSVDWLGHLTDLMFDRDGQHLFVSHGDRGAISVLDASNGKLRKEIGLAAGDDAVVELLRTPGGKTGLALHGDSGLVSALNLDDQVEVGSTRLPGSVHRGFPSANSQYFFLPIGGGETVSMVSSWTHREADRLPGVKSMTGFNVAMFDSVAFALGGEGRVAKMVSLLGTPGPKIIDLPGHPETGLTVELGTKVYVALSDTDQIAVIDAIGKGLMGVIDDVGDEPWAIASAGGLGYCH